LEVAVRLLRRRYPVVVADRPSGHYEWVLSTDHVVVVGSLDGVRPAGRRVGTGQPPRARDGSGRVRAAADDAAA
jgi:hypothetical protein